MSIEESGKIAWAAADWGTTQLRIWLMNDCGSTVKRLDSTAGMRTLPPESFEPVLIELLEPWLTDDRVLPVLCCGMVGARQGWSDSGYLPTPHEFVQGTELHFVASRDERISVSIVPGICQDVPPDVMRGEETQIAGFLHTSPRFSGVLCLPGTHTKWVEMSQGVIVRFATCMSGELFALLSEQSVLRHSVSTRDFDATRFEQAVRRIMPQPALLSADLFSLRADALLHDAAAIALRSRLSGLLIGSELAAMQTYWKNRTVTLIGDSHLCSLYERALASQSITCVSVDGDDMTLTGLSTIHTLRERLT